MNKNTTTTFTPEYNYRIDRREYFSDAGIDEQTSLIQYQNAIAAGNYSLASTIANEAASLNYGAWVFERFVNRIIAVENYAINLVNLKPKLTAYQNTEPNISDYEDNFAWVSSYVIPEYKARFLWGDEPVRIFKNSSGGDGSNLRYTCIPIGASLYHYVDVVNGTTWLKSVLVAPVNLNAGNFRYITYNSETLTPLSQYPLSNEYKYNGKTYYYREYVSVKISSLDEIRDDIYVFNSLKDIISDYNALGY